MKIVVVFFALVLLFVSSAFAQNAGSAERGEAVFDLNCQPCHGTGPGDDGAPMLPGTHALYLKYEGEKPALLQQRSDLTADALAVFIRNGIASMPPFRKTEITDQDISDIAAYIQSNVSE